VIVAHLVIARRAFLKSEPRYVNFVVAFWTRPPNRLEGGNAEQPILTLLFLLIHEQVIQFWLWQVMMSTFFPQIPIFTLVCFWLITGKTVCIVLREDC
jgi:hypothetical protein